MQSYLAGYSIKNWPEEDRPREKMLSKGIQVLSDSELLALIIGSGTRNNSAVQLAKEILCIANNNLDKLGKYSINDFKKHKGIGEARAVAIIAALELGRRRKQIDTPADPLINQSHAVFNLMHPILGDLAYEEFWILILNRSNKLIYKRKISQGGVSGTIADLRLIMKMAIESLATSLILCHNHPSGNNKPSEADISMTKKIRETALLMDISLIDHVIIAGKKYFSFADENMI